MLADWTGTGNWGFRLCRRNTCFSYLARAEVSNRTASKLIILWSDQALVTAGVRRRHPACCFALCPYQKPNAGIMAGTWNSYYSWYLVLLGLHLYMPGTQNLLHLNGTILATETLLLPARIPVLPLTPGINLAHCICTDFWRHGHRTY